MIWETDENCFLPGDVNSYFDLSSTISLCKVLFTFAVYFYFCCLHSFFDLSSRISLCKVLIWETDENCFLSCDVDTTYLICLRRFLFSVVLLGMNLSSLFPIKWTKILLGCLQQVLEKTQNQTALYLSFDIL